MKRMFLFAALIFALASNNVHAQTAHPLDMTSVQRDEALQRVATHYKMTLKFDTRPGDTPPGGLVTGDFRPLTQEKAFETLLMKDFQMVRQSDGTFLISRIGAPVPPASARTPSAPTAPARTTTPVVTPAPAAPAAPSPEIPLTPQPQQRPIHAGASAPRIAQPVSAGYCGNAAGCYVSDGVNAVVYNNGPSYLPPYTPPSPFGNVGFHDPTHGGFYQRPVGANHGGVIYGGSNYYGGGYYDPLYLANAFREFGITEVYGSFKIECSRDDLKKAKEELGINYGSCEEYLRRIDLYVNDRYKGRASKFNSLFNGEIPVGAGDVEVALVDRRVTGRPLAIKRIVGFESKAVNRAMDSNHVPIPVYPQLFVGEGQPWSEPVRAVAITPVK